MWVVANPKVDTSTYGDVDRTLQEIIDRQTNPSFKIFQNQPTAPYSLGDLWLNGVYVYDCIVDNDTVFNQSDWRLRSSSTLMC